jgi:hypothetical protein
MVINNFRSKKMSFSKKLIKNLNFLENWSN